MTRRFFIAIAGCLAATVGLNAQSFNIPANGGASLTTAGNQPWTNSGQVRVVASPTMPAGMAVFGYRVNGTLAAEATVPASPLTRSARIYAEFGNQVNTGLAVANSGDQPVNVSFSFVSSDGSQNRQGMLSLGPNGQTASFIDQEPFSITGTFIGTLTLTAPTPIVVIALRGLTNERSEFRITTVPVIDLTSSAATSTAAAIFPHFAVGGGWTTQIVLVNPSDSAVSGTVAFFDSTGQASSMTVGNVTNSTFSYSIPSRASSKLVTSVAGAGTATGFIRLTPASGNISPSAIAILSYKENGVTLTEAGVSAVAPASSLRMYVETSGTTGQPGNIRTGVAIANTSASIVFASFELRNLSGDVVMSGAVPLPGNFQAALFLDELPGASSVPRPFQGILRLTTGTAPISMLGLRARYNERNEFLITSLPAVAVSTPAATQPGIFPHFADGLGYTTQFIFFGASGEATSGSLNAYLGTGDPIVLPTR